MEQQFSSYEDVEQQAKQDAEQQQAKQYAIGQFLLKVLGADTNNIEKDSQAILEHLSSDTIDHMISFLDYATMCPMATKHLISNFHNTVHQQYEEREKDFYCPFHENNICLHLTDLKIGEKAKILKLTASGAIRRRLIDMGVLPDVEVELQSIAPLGDPIKIKIKDYYLTLRKAEAESILLQEKSVISESIDSNSSCSNEQ